MYLICTNSIVFVREERERESGRCLGRLIVSVGMFVLSCGFAVAVAAAAAAEY